MSIAVDGFPNMFQALGPNAGVGAGNLLLVMERQVDYAVAATLKVQRERLKSIEAKPEAVADFEEYIEASNCVGPFTAVYLSWSIQSYFPTVSLVSIFSFPLLTSTDCLWNKMSFLVQRRKGRRAHRRPLAW